MKPADYNNEKNQCKAQPKARKMENNTSNITGIYLLPSQKCFTRCVTYKSMTAVLLGVISGHGVRLHDLDWID